MSPRGKVQLIAWIYQSSQSYSYLRADYSDSTQVSTAEEQAPLNDQQRGAEAMDMCGTPLAGGTETPDPNTAGVSILGCSFDSEIVPFAFVRPTKSKYSILDDQVHPSGKVVQRVDSKPSAWRRMTMEARIFLRFPRWDNNRVSSFLQFIRRVYRLSGHFRPRDVFTARRNSRSVGKFGLCHHDSQYGFEVRSPRAAMGAPTRPLALWVCIHRRCVSGHELRLPRPAGNAPRRSVVRRSNAIDL